MALRDKAELLAAFADNTAGLIAPAHVRDLVESAASLAWPVGSIFTSVADTDPALLLGFGTWEPLAAGRVLIGLDAAQPEFDTLGETGGAKEVTLTVAQMPGHTHTQDPHTHAQNPHGHVQRVNSATTGALSGYAPDTSTSTPATSGYSTVDATAINQSATAVNQSTGGGQPHTNLPPYLIVRFWKRVA